MRIEEVTNENVDSVWSKNGLSERLYRLKRSPRNAAGTESNKHVMNNNTQKPLYTDNDGQGETDSNSTATSTTPKNWLLISFIVVYTILNVISFTLILKATTHLALIVQLIQIGVTIIYAAWSLY